MFCQIPIQKLTNIEDTSLCKAIPTDSPTSEIQIERSIDRTKDTPADEVLLTESSNEPSLLQFHNEIIAEQLKDKLYSYKISNDEYLKGRKSTFKDLIQCESQFGEFRNSVNGILIDTKSQRNKLTSILNHIQIFDSFSVEYDKKRLLCDELRLIQQRIRKMDQRVSNVEYESIKTQWDNFLITEKVQNFEEGVDEKLKIENEELNITCSSCNIF